MGYNFADDYLTVQEVAEKLRLSELTIYKYIKDGDLAAIEFGGHYRVSVPSFQKFLNNHIVEVKND